MTTADRYSLWLDEEERLVAAGASVAEQDVTFERVMASDLAMRDLEAAADTITACRLKASEYRQMGCDNLAKYLQDNAKTAERWMVSASVAHPNRCDSRGRPIRDVGRGTRA